MITVTYREQESTKHTISKNHAIELFRLWILKPEVNPSNIQVAWQRFKRDLRVSGLINRHEFNNWQTPVIQ